MNGRGAAEPLPMNSADVPSVDEESKEDIAVSLKRNGDDQAVGVMETFSGGAVMISRWAAVVAGGLLVGVALGQPSDSDRLAVASAIKALRDAGAFIGYEDNHPNRPVISVRAIGSMEDHELARAAAFKKLDHLFVDSPRITDAGVAGLKGLAELRDVGLHCPKVGDGALKHLASLPKLERLSLLRTGVTDAGMKELAALPNLKQLILSQTALTDAGLMTLAGAKKLEKVSVYETKVTDAGVKAFNAARPGCKVDR